jgi:hypothetical protein
VESRLSQREEDRDAGSAYRDHQDPAGYPGGAPSAGRGVDKAGLRRWPGPGEWAIIEVVAHLADKEERALAWVRRMLSEDNPELKPFDQEALAVQRRYLDLDLQAELAPPGVPTQPAPSRAGHPECGGLEVHRCHGEHGHLSVELYETHVAAEEVDHLAQIARLL